MAYYIKFDRDGYGRDRYRDDGRRRERERDYRGRGYRRERDRDDYRRRDRDGYERDDRGRFDDEEEYGSRRRRHHEYDDDDDYDDEGDDEEGRGVEKYERDVEDALRWLDENCPETWEPYKDKVGGKKEIMEMEIKEFQNALFKKKEGTLTHEEFKTSVEHVIAAGLLLHRHLRKGN